MEIKLMTGQEAIKAMEYNAAFAALTCHANTNKDFVPSEVLQRIIKRGHESVLEHINLTYSVKGISRALLQELARHRHISLSVESTRHTLKKFLESDEMSIMLANEEQQRARAIVAFLSVFHSNPGMSNDELKYYLPEFWPTNLVLTTNIRELRHILDLRTAPAALKEFRVFARELFNVVPDEFKYLLQDCVHEEVIS